MMTQIEKLTYKIWALCKGKDTAVVIGTSLNIAFSAMLSIEDEGIKKHFVNSLRDMADKIESGHQLERLQ